LGEELQVNDRHERSVTPTSLLEELIEACAYYLSIGLSVEDFWWGDNFLPKIYRKAHRLKMKQENAMMYRQGLYFYEALCDVSPVLHAFAKGGTKPIPFSQEPYPLDAQEVEERENEIRRQQYERIRSKMLGMVNDGKHK